MLLHTSSSSFVTLPGNETAPPIKLPFINFYTNVFLSR